MKQLTRIITVIVIWAFAVAFFSISPIVAKSRVDDSARLTKATELASEQFDANTIANWMQNNGQIVSYKVTGSAGMEWPKGSDKTIDFQSGLWMVGKTPEGQIRTAASEYATEFSPGPILSDGTAADPDLPEYRIYKINSDGTGDWDVWPFDQGAPALKAADGSDSLDANGNKIPQLIGDQTLWWVMNDLDPTAHANLFSTAAMGVEQQVMVFGYNTSDPLGNIMFVKWTIINKSSTDYDSCFVAVWDDPDLGDAADDLVGCDTTLSLGYCYNGGPVDATYGTTPPAIGFDFFQGPEVPKGSGNYLPMTSFIYYWNGAPDPFGDPEDATQMFNFMKGFTNDGTSYLDPNSAPSKYVFNGDPVTGSGWLDSAPADRRFLMSSGPFTLTSGDTQVVVGAKIIAPGTDNLAAVNALRFFDSFAQNAFDNNFQLPTPPAPVATALGMQGKIVLNWQDEVDKYKTIESYEFSGYNFEGYNVYQGESQAGPWKRIATFDVVSDFGIVFDNSFDANTGMVLNQPVAFGANTGITRNFTVTADAISGLPLNNYQNYYFSVTAYAVNPDVSPKVVESGKVAITAVPKTTTLGIKTAAEEGETIQVTHASGTSDGSVTPVVVDPEALTGHTYQVTFAQGESGFVWNLIDKTSGATVLENQSNQTGDENYLIADGVKVYVSGPPPGMKDWDIPQGTRRFTWGGGAGAWEFEGFGGAMGWGQPATFWGSGYEYPAANLKNVLLVLAKVDEDGNFDVNDPNVSYGYRWLRSASADPAKPEFAPFIKNPGDGYAFQEFAKSVPLAAFDVEDPANPRRLVVGHLENNKAGGLVDGKWWPPDYTVGNNTDGDGPREWLWIFDQDYSETPDPKYQNDIISSDLPAMWWILAARRGNVPFSPGGTGEDHFLILANHINAESDIFEFTSAAPSVGTDVAKAQIDMINAVPNPYFAWSPTERTPTERIMRFTNLPGNNATIRIFDLAGNLVRIIDDEARTAQGTNGTSYAQWDLRNSADVPVAGGMYIVYVEVEGVGAKTLKIAVINRDERLLYY